MACLALFIYRLIMAVLIWPFVFFLRDHPNFRGTMAERFGFVLPEAPEGKSTIWIHAASVGEVKAVSGLIRAIRQLRPGVFIFLTSMTATGREVACKMPDIDLVFPLPFDLPWVMKRYLLRLMPRVILIVETEIWPDMLTQADNLAIPVFFVNARMSEDSFLRYRKVSWLLKTILKPVKILAITKTDAQRFSALGARQAEVLGNLKFDAIPLTGTADISSMREGIGASRRLVFIAGSVREGEEAYVMDAIRAASDKVPGLFSIVAPRHPDRVRLIEQLALERGLASSLRSSGPSSAQVLIIDTMGELFTLYGISDAAFVGGSLVDLGGQNILEPIAWGVPTIHGPHMDNFTWALNIVKEKTYLVRDSHELAETLVNIMRDRDASRMRGQDALDALMGTRGATGRYLKVLEPLI